VTLRTRPFRSFLVCDVRGQHLRGLKLDPRKTHMYIRFSLCRCKCSLRVKALEQPRCSHRNLLSNNPRPVLRLRVRDPITSGHPIPNVRTAAWKERRDSSPREMCNTFWGLVVLSENISLSSKKGQEGRHGIWGFVVLSTVGSIVDGALKQLRKSRGIWGFVLLSRFYRRWGAKAAPEESRESDGSYCMNSTNTGSVQL
jgi:hypothetical protein